MVPISTCCYLCRMKAKKVNVNKRAATVLDKVAPVGGKITQSGYTSEAIVEKFDRENSEKR